MVRLFEPGVQKHRLMKLTHIFWSLFVVVAMILLPVGLFLNRGKLNGGPEIFGTFLIFWWLITILTPILLIVAYVKKRTIRNNFTFTLLATLNLYFGLMGFYHLPKAGPVREYLIYYAIFFLNLAMAAIISYFQMRKK